MSDIFYLVGTFRWSPLFIYLFKNWSFYSNKNSFCLVVEVRDRGWLRCSSFINNYLWKVLRQLVRCVCVRVRVCDEKGRKMCREEEAIQSLERGREGEIDICTYFLSLCLFWWLFHTLFFFVFTHTHTHTLFLSPSYPLFPLTLSHSLYHTPPRSLVKEHRAVINSDSEL